MSFGIEYKTQSGFTREQAERTEIGKEVAKSMKRILALEVPIVLASGNYSDRDKCASFDMIPQVLKKDDFPDTNVGAATLEGKAWPVTQGKRSQDGTQLAIYAVRVDVQVHNQIDVK
jgi:hypothetical protein